MKFLSLTAALAMAASASFAADKYTLDSSHSQVLFNYDHIGFSTTYGMFSGIDGEILFDEANPSASSVNVSIPVKSMFTGWEKREGHFLSADFFNVEESALVTFKSTSIEVTGENTANITGDLTMAGVTKAVVLDATLNKTGIHPQANKPWLGFDATTSVLRTDFGLGKFAPNVSDEVKIAISVEAAKAE
ncbi:MAG: YceI family protein [Litoreibacter sp.]